MSIPFEIATAQRGRAPRLVRALAWVGCIAAMYALFTASGDALRDPDSTLYAQIAHQLAHRPLAQWIAPDFPQGRFKGGPFMEHLAVFFWPAAALDRLGFTHGAVLANFAYALALLWLLFELTRRMADKHSAWITLAAYTLSPLGIQYLLRANHENAWTLGFIGGAICMLELGTASWAGPLLCACAVWAFLIKGVLALAFFPVMLAIAFAARNRKSLAWLAVAAIAVVLAAVAYELAYRAATHHAFFATYLDIQTGYAMKFESRGATAKLATPLYYALNLLWFALPGSLLAIRAALRQERSDAFRVGATGAGTHVALLSLMSRHAVRYVFPAYALLHVAGAPELARIPRLRSWLERNEARLPFLAMISLVGILALRIAVDVRAYHFVDVLRGWP